MAKHSKHAAHSRRAIAAQAARLMAQDGIAEFGAAKRKAARQLGFSESDALPSNDEVELELRTYQTIYQGEDQRTLVLELRELALEVMSEFAPYQPLLAGPVWNGTATAESAITIDLFADSPKMIEVILLDAELPYHVHEWPHFNQAIERKVPVLSFEHENQVINLVVYSTDDFRGALKPDADGRMRRGDIRAVQALVDANTPDSDIDTLLTAIR